MWTIALEWMITFRRSAVLALALLTLLSDAAYAQCPTDCNGNQRVALAEMMTAVSIFLGNTSLDVCPAADADQDGEVEVGELVAGVRAAIHDCPPPIDPTLTPAATPSVTPTHDPQVPPMLTTDLTSWLEGGPYKSWRKVVEYGTSGHAVDDGRPVRTYVNDALYASLICYPGDDHPEGAAGVQEILDYDRQTVLGWSVSRKVLPDSDGGRGWYWYSYFDGAVHAAGSGITDCANCHDTGSRDYYANEYSPSLLCDQFVEFDHGICNELGLPPKGRPYDGQVTDRSGQKRRATLYRASDTTFSLESVYFYSTGAGRFNRLLCASDYPRPVAGTLTFSPDESEVEFEYYSTTDDREPYRFRGFARD